MAEAGTGAAPGRPARVGVIRTGLVSMVALAAVGLTRLVHGSMVSRATDTETYGQVGSLIAVATIASLLLPAGVASAAGRFIPHAHGRGDDAAARAAYHFLFRTGLIGAVLLGLGAGAGAAAAFRLDPGPAAEVVALTVAFAVYSIDKATLYGFGLVHGYVRLELGTSALAVLATVLVIATGSTAYLLPLALGYGSFAVGARWLLRGQVRGAAPAGRVDRRAVLGYVALACVGTLASQGFLQGTQLLANVFAAPGEVAFFVAAVTLVAPMYFLPRALGLALFPAMSRAHGAGDIAGVRRQADLSTRALLLGLAPVFAAGILLAPEVLTIFGGPRYAGGAPVLRLLLAATFLAVVAVAAVNTLSSGERVRVPVASAVLGCLLGLGTVALLGGPWGAVGVGVGYLVGTAVTAGGPLVVVWRTHRMAWGVPLAVSLAGVLAALLVGTVLGWLDLGGGAGVLADAGAAVLAAGLLGAVVAGRLRALVAAGRTPQDGAPQTGTPPAGAPQTGAPRAGAPQDVQQAATDGAGETGGVAANAP